MVNKKNAEVFEAPNQPAVRRAFVVHRTADVTTTVSGDDLQADVSASGALVIKSSAGALFAFAPGQWKTVGVTPIV